VLRLFVKRTEPSMIAAATAKVSPMARAPRVSSAWDPSGASTTAGRRMAWGDRAGIEAVERRFDGFSHHGRVCRTSPSIVRPAAQPGGSVCRRRPPIHRCDVGRSRCCGLGVFLFWLLFMPSALALIVLCLTHYQAKRFGPRRGKHCQFRSLI